jgi:Ca2+-binding RTX toxin-like protein
MSLRATDCSGSCRAPIARKGRLVRSGQVALTFTVASVVAVLTPAVPAHAAGATCRGVKATIVGTPSAEVIHGTAARDVIAGLGGNDTIFAKRGRDLVCGGQGADHIHGGAGNDRLYGQLDRRRRLEVIGDQLIGDTLRGGPGNDRLDAGFDRRPGFHAVPDAYSWHGSVHRMHIDLRAGTARGEGADTLAKGMFTVIGSPRGDVILGTGRSDLIEAGAGPDVVLAGRGSDIIVVDATHRGLGGDADRVWGGGGSDRITATWGQDHLDGGAKPDRITATGGGSDVLTGGAGCDFLTGEIADTDQPQSFEGGPGPDTLEIRTDKINPQGAASTGDWSMATGAMTFTLDHQISLSATSISTGGLETPGTAWTVTGTAARNSIGGARVATTAPIRFDGLAGDDFFFGTDGDDVFDGGPGDDFARTFGGDDTCIGVERIEDACEHVS